MGYTHKSILTKNKNIIYMDYTTFWKMVLLVWEHDIKLEIGKSRNRPIKEPIIESPNVESYFNERGVP